MAFQQNQYNHERGFVQDPQFIDSTPRSNSKKKFPQISNAHGTNTKASRDYANDNEFLNNLDEEIR